jgi:hypothetical protein
VVCSVGVSLRVHNCIIRSADSWLPARDRRLAGTGNILRVADGSSRSDTRRFRAHTEGGHSRDECIGAEALFRRESESVVVSMVVVFIETDRPQALAGLPAESGPLPKAVADDLVAGMIRVAPNVRQHVRTTPLLYDDTRKAFGVELISRGPSLARTLLLQPDTSPD